jgi:DNA invertase Pin-like site-specific DNA recombinase
MIGYARVSTTEQATSGLGLAAQRTAIEAEAQRRGWELMEIVTDEGASGKDLDRPGLLRALGLIAEGKADGLVAAKLDRISRSVVDFGMLLEWFQEHKAVLVALDLGVDTSTPGGKLVAGVFSCVAEWERSVIGERTRVALGALRADGRAVSGPAVADDAALRDRVLRLRAAGMSRQAICDVLNAEEVPTPRGGRMWRPSSLQAVEGYERPKRRRSAVLPTAGRRRSG